MRYYYPNEEKNRLITRCVGIGIIGKTHVSVSQCESQKRKGKKNIRKIIIKYRHSTNDDLVSSAYITAGTYILYYHAYII